MSVSSGADKEIIVKMADYARLFGVSDSRKRHYNDAKHCRTAWKHAETVPDRGENASNNRENERNDA
ncbi:MAG: hypothetical protein KGJ06_03385 [Pseudomonadota bacterium]|nr:hypothetical protein [Pseudomonadota bacterium]